MDESVAQSPEQEIPANTSQTSAVPTSTDGNDTGIISDDQFKISRNAEPEGITLPSTTAINSTLQNLQMDIPSELFVHPTFRETSAISPAEIPNVSASSFIPSARQTKYADTGNVDKEEPAEKLIHDQYDTKDFSTSSKNLEEISKLPASMISTEENPAENTRKNENGFIFYKCRFCGLTYNYLTTLRAHERVHNIDEPYKCSRCSESFHYLCELEYHAKQHTDLKGYKCECGRTFHSYTDLLYHKHPGDEDESVTATAPITTKSAPLIPETDFPIPEFVEKGFEPKHPLKVYSDVRVNPYICQYCSKSYPNSRMLAYHMYGHRGERIFNPRASRYLMARTENSYISPGS
uniref:Zinc finger protein unc-98 n=1 Tax=Elaeophora elaphi TaxID=1147741 RepID=A0A0R3RRW1_9BILA